MRSRTIKLLHPVAGRPMVALALETVQALSPSRVIGVVGFQADKVRKALDGYGCTFVLQKEQRGTGHAVLQAARAIGSASRSTLLIVNGDVPLLRPATLRGLLAKHRRSGAALTVLTTLLEDPTGYGRVVRNAQSRLTRIVEHRDANVEQRRIREINSGIYCAHPAKLLSTLKRIKPNNAQGEYYLTDLIALAVRSNVAVEGLSAQSAEEVAGVNDRQQLAQLERHYQAREAERLMYSGVTLADPARLDIRGTVVAGEDCFIDINVVLEGQVRLGRRVSIGPGVVVKDTQIGDDVAIAAHTVIEGATVAAGCQLGPFARIRPGTELAENVKIGNFVETKKARLGRGTKASHLSYLGDATLGEGCNIGAGTVTCNYDGIDKHHTHIGDNVFIGTNSTLVAPLEIGAESFVAAGSTITSKVGTRELAVSRGRQRNIEGWTRPVDRTGQRPANRTSQRPADRTGQRPVDATKQPAQTKPVATDGES